MTKADWLSLEPQWQRAFNLVLANTAETDMPDEQQLEQLSKTTILRLVGPTAQYPNMNFELTNLSGLVYLSLLEIVVISHHQITSLENLSHANRLKSLFVMNNQLTSLSGIEELTDLEILYCQNNRIEELISLEELVNLRELSVSRNKLNSIAGITTAHEPKLDKFYVLPNEGLRDKDIMRFERELGIRCRMG
jgi:Leucine-rich repeat (LRR) protein